MVDCSLHVTAATLVWVLDLGILEFPGIAALVVQQAGVIIAFIQVLEGAGEYLRLLV